MFGATAVETVTGSDGTQYRKVSLSRGLPRAVPLASARLLRPTAAAALWSSPTDTSYPLAAGVTWLYLSGIVPQIRSGGRFVARGPSERAAFTITSIVQAMRLLVPATTVGDNKRFRIHSAIALAFSGTDTHSSAPCWRSSASSPSRVPAMAMTGVMAV